jgi:hypothetical protein
MPWGLWGQSDGHDVASTNSQRSYARRVPLNDGAREIHPFRRVVVLAPVNEPKAGPAAGFGRTGREVDRRRSLATTGAETEPCARSPNYPQRDAEWQDASNAAVHRDFGCRVRARQRREVREQAHGQRGANLRAAIASMTWGDLANGSHLRSCMYLHTLRRPVHRQGNPTLGGKIRLPNSGNAGLGTSQSFKGAPKMMQYSTDGGSRPA